MRESARAQTRGPDQIKLRQLPNGDTTGDFIPAESGWSVMVFPGAGAEPAEFGLCHYPGNPLWMLTGALKDSLGKGPKGVQAEIFNDARFERLEAEGRAEFAAKIEEARRIIQAIGGGPSRAGID